jgi:hypothetical protein
MLEWASRIAAGKPTLYPGTKLGIGNHQVGHVIDLSVDLAAASSLAGDLQNIILDDISQAQGLENQHQGTLQRNLSRQFERHRLIRGDRFHRQPLGIDEQRNIRQSRPASSARLAGHVAEADRDLGLQALLNLDLLGRTSAVLAFQHLHASSGQVLPGSTITEDNRLAVVERSGGFLDGHHRIDKPASFLP